MTTQASVSGHFSEMLASLARTGAETGISFREIAEFMERRSIGALMLVFALPMVIPVPAPGISVAFGVPLIVVSAQLLMGLSHVWLPARLANRRLDRAKLKAMVDAVGPWLSKVEKIARPRATWLVEGTAAVWVSGAACVAMAVIITLPIPLGHFIPGAAVSLIALGLVERDGVLVAVGLVVSLFAAAVVTLASAAFLTWINAWTGGV